jgi:hypothetical protein
MTALTARIASRYAAKRIVKLDGRGYRIDIWHQVLRY